MEGEGVVEEESVIAEVSMIEGEEGGGCDRRRGCGRV